MLSPLMHPTLSPSLLALCTVSCDLSARFACAAVRFVSDQDVIDSVRADARDHAFRTGMSAFDKGVGMPALYGGEPLLESAWADGFDFQAQLDMMAACSDCHEREMCPFHG